MYHTILVPLDGSAFAEQALPTAITLALRTRATLDLVRAHVLYAFEDPTCGWQQYSPSEDAEFRQQEENYLASIAQRCRERQADQITSAILEGQPAEAILTRAQQVRADLIIMTTHGLGAVSRAFLGSVADELVRQCSLPLLIIRPHEALPDFQQEASIRKVLIPLDKSATAEQILEPAVQLGSAMGASYRLLYVVAPNSDLAHKTESDRASGLHRSMQECDAEAGTTYLQEVASRLQAQSLTVEAQVVVHPHVPTAIITEAESKHCDIIALATHGRGGLSRLLLGSVADKVLRSSSLPVLVFRNKGQGKA